MKYLIGGLMILSILILAFFLQLFGGQQYEYHPFNFDSSNLTDVEMRIDSVMVLQNNVRAGGRYPKRVRSNSVGFSRRDCTPEALLETPAKITWWERRFSDPKTNGATPLEPDQKKVSALAFPEFEVDEYAWACHFTLQPDYQWIGQYDGVKAKPIGAKPALQKKSLPLSDQQWIHVQFRSSHGDQYFSQKTCKLTRGDEETLLYIPDLKGDGKFHGFAAHSQKGSIFRPVAGSKIILDWGTVSRWDADQYQEFELPNFSNEKKNWYCYFTLGEDKKWTAIFEGTKEP